MDRQMEFVDGKMNKLEGELLRYEADMDDSYLARIKGLKEAEIKFQAFLSKSDDVFVGEVKILLDKEEKIQDMLSQLKEIEQFKAHNFNELTTHNVLESMYLLIIQAFS